MSKLDKMQSERFNSALEDYYKVLADADALEKAASFFASFEDDLGYPEDLRNEANYLRTHFADR